MVLNCALKDAYDREESPFGDRNPVAHYARMEEELLEQINDLGIGPLGMGGRVTALVAVNLQCHASRHASAEI